MVNKSVSDDCLARECQVENCTSVLIDNFKAITCKVNRQPWINLKFNTFVENLLIFNIVKYSIAEIHTTRECDNCDALQLKPANGAPVGLLVTGILSRTVSELSQLIVQISDTLQQRFRGIGTTYDVYLGFIGKRVVDFLLV